MQTGTGDPAKVQPEAVVAVPRRTQRPPRMRKPGGYHRDEVIMGYLFVVVPMVVLAVFWFGAMGFDFWISFYHWAILDAPRFVGSANYNFIFRVDTVFITALQNTLTYAVIVVPIQTVVAFFLALIVNQNIRGRTFFRTTFYFPSITSSVAISVIFLYLFNNTGLINTLLSDVHIQGPNWLGDPHIALKSIAGLNIWTTTGTLMVIFLAALQDVPRDTLEAAVVDGAGTLRSIVSIIVPAIRPALFFVVANGLIGSLQIFDQAYILSQGSGGPENSTMTAVLYIYNRSFGDGFYGPAAAASFVLFLLIFLLTFGVRRFFREETA